MLSFVFTNPLPRQCEQSAKMHRFSDGLIRFSCGIEDARDLTADLDAALSKVRKK